MKEARSTEGDGVFTEARRSPSKLSHRELLKGGSAERGSFRWSFGAAGALFCLHAHLRTPAHATPRLREDLAR